MDSKCLFHKLLLAFVILIWRNVPLITTVIATRGWFEEEQTAIITLMKGPDGISFWTATVALEGRKVSDLINKSSSCERSDAPMGVRSSRGREVLEETWWGVKSGGGDAGEGGSSLLRLCWNAYLCWQRRNGPGDKVFHSHVQHPAVEPTNVALLSMQGLIRQNFKEQGPSGNEDSREALLFIVWGNIQLRYGGHSATSSSQG